MTPKQRKIYEKAIGEVAQNLMLECWKSANAITDGVYFDILATLRQCIDVQLSMRKEGGEK